MNKKPRRHYRRVTPKERATILAERSTGLSYKQLGRLHGRASPTIRRICLDLVQRGPEGHSVEVRRADLPRCPTCGHVLRPGTKEAVNPDPVDGLKNDATDGAGRAER